MSEAKLRDHCYYKYSEIFVHPQQKAARFGRICPQARGFNWRNFGTQAAGSKTKAQVIKYTVPGIQFQKRSMIRPAGPLRGACR
jgi:hypothetical protein